MGIRLNLTDTHDGIFTICLATICIPRLAHAMGIDKRHGDVFFVIGDHDRKQVSNEARHNRLLSNFGIGALDNLTISMS